MGWLYIRAVDRHTDTSPPVRSAIVPSARALILCVERDPHIRELEAYFLDQAGFVVHFVEDGAQALELARSLKPAIIITEILVPRLDGLALCQHLKTTPETRHIPIVVCSVLAAEARAREAGAEAFLRKPLAQNRLVQVAHELLHRTPPSAASDSA
jgi:CheY-like chemotaxis protein